MLVSFSYRFRNSVIEKIDPRARWIFSIMMLFTIVNYWDARFLIFFFILAFAQVFASKVTWRETSRAWIFMFLLVFMMCFINVLVTSGGLHSKDFINGRSVFRYDGAFFLFGWPIHYDLTTGRLWFAVTQFIRIFAISAFFIIIPFTMDPRLYGTAFKGLGDKFAFSLDLAFRFVPTLGRDFNVTLDSQRARGYQVEKMEGGFFNQIRKTAPLIVPVTMNAIISGEDITNAMDLRCFGLKPRTWITQLTYRWYDKLIIILGAVLLIGSIILRNVFGIGVFWLPAGLY